MQSNGNKNFTMLSDAMIQELENLNDAVVFCKIKRLGDKFGKSKASIQTIADELKMNRKTVQRCIQKLLDIDWIVDVTPVNFVSKHQVRWYGINSFRFFETENTYDENLKLKRNAADKESDDILEQKFGKNQSLNGQPPSKNDFF